VMNRLERFLCSRYARLGGDTQSGKATRRAFACTEGQFSVGRQFRRIGVLSWGAARNHCRVA
ncbi:MAG: hypothetical protein KGL75_09595, partial [Acidobacteriota bacterium]|nr:hypothetical protein [Acidobacteriota bacterium]